MGRFVNNENTHLLLYDGQGRALVCAQAPALAVYVLLVTYTYTYKNCTMLSWGYSVNNFDKLGINIRIIIPLSEKCS